jgi:branched-chain amino acid transport system permease protein
MGLLDGFWEPVIVAAVVNAIAAVGLYVTVASGQWSMAHGAVMGVGAYVSAILTTNLQWPFATALIVSVGVGAGLGVIVAAATLRMSELVQSLATLGLGETLSVVAYNIPYLGGAEGFSGIPLDTTPIIAALGLAVVVVIAWRLDGSRFGLACRAIRDDPVAAAANGVSVGKVRIQAFGIGCAIAGLAGALGAHYTLVIFPGDLGFSKSFVLMVYVLFGGSYALLGPIVGAVVLTILPEFLRFATTYRFVLYGAAIVLVILLRPQGVITRLRRPPVDAFRHILRRPTTRA